MSSERGRCYIAWVANRWIGATERADLIATYTDYLDMLDEKYPEQDEMPADIIADYLDKAYELERLERIHRCESDLLQFAIEYFSEAKNPENDGNWEGFDISDKSQSPEFHKEITDIMNEVSTVRTNAKIAVAAPRSHAKSSYLSKAFPIHEVVYRKRKYTIIISETPTVSAGNMEWIRNQMKFNEKLREDFGPLLSPKDQTNITDKEGAFIAWYQDGDRRRQVALVEAASTGQALRGRNWNGTRPDLIILDDLEDPRPGGNASTQEQRAKLKDWFAQTVIPLGDPKGERTAFVYMGTTVHFDALLMDVLYRRSDFRTKVYRAVINYPERMDLWDKCRDIYKDHENGNRRDDAIAFYERYKDEMLKGAKVLWEDAQPIFKLMSWKWDNNSKAFNTEYQNNPIDEESMIFNPDNFSYWDKDRPHRGFPHSRYTYSMGVDFAMGKERGDYSAIVVLAKDKETGAMYVIEAYGERVKPDRFLDIIVEKVLKYQPDKIAAEAQAAQEFFVDTLKAQLAANGYPSSTRVKKVKQRSRKELRIEAMLTPIENGEMHFSQKHRLLLEQFERYGQGGHDDLPDALEMAYSAIKRRTASSRTLNKAMR